MGYVMVFALVYISSGPGFDSQSTYKNFFEILMMSLRDICVKDSFVIFPVIGNIIYNSFCLMGNSFYWRQYSGWIQHPRGSCIETGRAKPEVGTAV